MFDAYSHSAFAAVGRHARVALDHDVLNFELRNAASTTEPLANDRSLHIPVTLTASTSDR
jgi:hypothetical protein